MSSDTKADIQLFDPFNNWKIFKREKCGSCSTFPYYLQIESFYDSQEDERFGKFWSRPESSYLTPYFEQKKLSSKKNSLNKICKIRFDFVFILKINKDFRTDMITECKFLAKILRLFFQTRMKSKIRKSRKLSGKNLPPVLSYEMMVEYRFVLKVPNIFNQYW